MAKRPKQLPRILLVEDSDDRARTLQSWVPANIRVVWAKSGGDAVGILTRDGGAVYAGIMLDHDLHQQLRDPGAKQLNGADVARKIVECVELDTPIFIHSMNPQRRGGHSGHSRRSGVRGHSDPDERARRSKARGVAR